MKYAAIVIFVALLFLLAWKLVDKNHKSDKHYLNWHSSTFDIASEKAKVQSVREIQPQKEPEPLVTNETLDSFGDKYERFLSDQKLKNISQFEKLGFTSQADYEDTLATELRFLMEKFQQNILQFLRNENLTEEQISAFLQIEDDFKSQVSEIYRIPESDYHANYEQRERAQELSSARHNKMLEVLSPATLNEITIEQSKFFKNARENYNLRAYEYGY
jgi:uncharacterized protein YdiU (UPF0061 family)